MRVNVFDCLLAFALVCAGSNTNAEINHKIVEEKDPATLPCPPSVKDRPTATWSRESKGSKVDILTVAGDGHKKHIHDPFKRYQSEADNSLYITKTNVSDTGKYFCNDEPAVELTVIPPGTARQRAVEKTNVTLKCPHAGLDVLTWSRIISGGEQDIYVIQNGTGKHLQGQGRRFGSTKDKSLTITKVKPADSGLYYCDGKPAVHLTVIKAPTETPPTETATAMTQGTARQSAVEKTSVTLKCPHAGLDVLTWSRIISGGEKDIYVIQNGMGKHVQGQGRRFGSTKDKSLTVTKVKPADSGLYYCDGKPAVHLTVIKAPTETPPTETATAMTQGTARQRAVEKTNVTLKCPHAGLDVLTWSRIISGGEQDIYVIENGTGKHVPGQGRCFGSTKDKSLTVTKVKPADSGLYYCDGKPAVHLTVIKAPTETPPTETAIAMTTIRTATTLIAPVPLATSPSTSTPPTETPPTETATAMTTIRTTTTVIAPVPLATSPSTSTPPTIILPSTPLATTRMTATTPGYWQLPVGTVSGILLFIIVFITWRCWSKRRGSDEQRVEPIYTEIPDGSVVQPTCGVKRPTGPSAIYYLADFPAKSKTPAVWLDGPNQSDDTYCIIPDPAPVQPGDKTETSVPNNSTYSLITGPNLQGNNEETPLDQRENFFSN
ncbi:mucin-5B-like isoform X2 [Centroberyx affinis]|uniref:mucin-5B-like isoform X2 n=1 Tax=Centroberyx affinis TaxID=166261 RepID=UPI003A5C0434